MRFFRGGSRRGLSIAGAIVFCIAVLVAADMAFAYLSASGTQTVSITSTSTPTSTTATRSSTSRTTSTASSSTLWTGQDVIGYVGCSETWMSVGDNSAGYHYLSARNLFWPLISAYSGGYIGLGDKGWSNASNYMWTFFDKEVQTYGQPQAVWVEACGVANPDGKTIANASYAQLMFSEFFSLLRSHAPGATVYLSMINNFTSWSPPLCSRMTLQQYDAMDSYVKYQVGIGAAHAGPVMGPLTASTILTGSTCHPNPAGQNLLGEQLVQFFDLGVPAASETGGD